MDAGHAQRYGRTDTLPRSNILSDATQHRFFLYYFFIILFNKRDLNIACITGHSFATIYLIRQPVNVCLPAGVIFFDALTGAHHQYSCICDHVIPATAAAWPARLSASPSNLGTATKFWPISVAAKWLYGSRYHLAGGRHRPGDFVLDGHPAPPPQKGGGHLSDATQHRFLSYYFLLFYLINEI